MRFISFIILLTIFGITHAEMYKWVDEKGNTHFSDRPVAEGAKTYTPPPIPTVPAAGPAGQLPPTRQATTGTVYKSIAVVEPKNDQVFTPDLADSVTVSVQMNPSTISDPEHQIVLYINGKEHAKGLQRSFTLTDLPRGTYTAQAAVITKKKKKLISSETISFHIQRHHR